MARVTFRALQSGRIFTTSCSTGNKLEINAWRHKNVGDSTRHQIFAPPFSSKSACFGFVYRGDCDLVDLRRNTVRNSSMHRPQAFPLRAGMFFSTPGPCEIQNVRGEMSEGIVITQSGAKNSFLVGGPANIGSEGHFKYIDGCSDSILLPPVCKGEPCLNLMFMPADTLQSAHTHPSWRLGLIVDGNGECIQEGDSFMPLASGDVFAIPPGHLHSFRTGPAQSLTVLTFHPDSDVGPTDDEHPMILGTLNPRQWQST